MADSHRPWGVGCSHCKKLECIAESNRRSRRSWKAGVQGLEQASYGDYDHEVFEYDYAYDYDYDRNNAYKYDKDYAFRN